MTPSFAVTPGSGPDQRLEPERQCADECAEYVSGDDDHLELLVDHHSQYLLHPLDAEGHHLPFHHRLHVELLHQFRDLLVDPVPDHRCGRRGEALRRIWILLRLGISKDVRYRLLEIGENGVVDRLRYLVPNLRLLQETHDLFDTIPLDGVEYRVELLLGHHQLGEDPLVEPHVLDEAVEHAVESVAHLHPRRGLPEECAQLRHRDRQVRGHRPLESVHDRRRNLVDQGLARCEDGGDHILEPRLKRGAELGTAELALKISGCQQPFANGAAETLRQPGLIFWYRSLKAEARLPWIEEHPDGDGVGHSPGNCPDRYLDAELDPPAGDGHLLDECAFRDRPVDRSARRVGEGALRGHIAVRLGGVGDRARSPRQEREVDDVVHRRDESERHAGHDLFRDSAQVLLVGLRENDLPQSSAVGGHHFLLYSSDLENSASQRHLAGESDVAPDGTSAQHTRNRQRDRRAGARPIFWYSTSGEMH